MSGLVYLALVVILLLVLAGLPVWPHTASWNAGYWPSGIGALLLVAVVILLLTGRL